MDTHINPDPDRERREPVFSAAALPPELRGGTGELGDRKEQGNWEESGGLGESGSASPTEQPEAAAPAIPKRRRSRLLVGVAAVALVGVGGAAFLLSPWNHVVPVPKLASTIHGLTQQAGLTKPPVLAPSASLASLNAPLPPPETREPYKPSGREAQVQEIIGFHAPEPGAPAAKPGTPPTHPVASQAPLQGPPRGYVPTEPGDVASPATPAATPDLTAAVMGTMRRNEAGPVAQTGSGGQAAPSAPSAPTSPPPAAPETASAAGSPAAMPSSATSQTIPVAPAPPASIAPAPQDAVSRAASLVAAPMTPAEQVDVLQTVTRLAAIVRDQKREVAELRADVAKANVDSASRLEDFSRRLTLAEARKTLAVAEQPAPADPTPAVDISTPPAASVLAPKPAVTLARLTVGTVPAPGDATARRYRVQAASPGLAMLAEVDRGGGEGAQLQVTVGDDLPGYGRVKSVSQRGTSWVVSTEHGVIGQ